MSLMPAHATQSQSGDPKSTSSLVELLTCIAILLFAVLLVFSPVFRHRFLSWDDNVNVYENPLLQPFDGENLRRIWSEPYQALYIPVTYTFLAGEAQIAKRENGELASWVFHVGNLLLHIANALLVFAVLKFLFQNNRASCVGAMLFALHPLQAETVSWVTETRGLLAAFFGIIALWQFLVCARNSILSPQPVKWFNSRWLHYAVGTLALLLALLSKPSAMAVVLMAFVLDVGFLRRPAARSMRSISLWLMVIVVFVILTKSQQPDTTLNFFRDLWARPLVAADALAFYLYKLLLPLGLAPEYGRSPDFILSTGWLYWSWLFPVAIAVGCWLLPARRTLLVALLLFVVALLPVLGLIPFGYQARSTVADRYAYLALIGPAFALTAAYVRWPKPITTIACSVILVILGWLTHEQVKLWLNDSTLFTHNLTINPRSVPSHTILGNYHASRGEHELAIEHYREAAKHNRQPRDSWNNVGDATRQLAWQRQAEGRTAESQQLLQQALTAYQEALAADTDYARTHDNFGQTLCELGREELGIDHYRRALEIDPTFVVAHHNLALALLSQGQFPESIAHVREAIRLRSESGEEPQATSFVVLGIALIKNKQYQEAVEAYRQALAIDPTSSDIQQRLDSLLRQLNP